MRADVLVAARGAFVPSEPMPPRAYAVPERLAGDILAGQLVAVPHGERLVAGIVWALDASDETGETDETGDDAPTADERGSLREIEAILVPEPVLLPAQQALAEWLADYYAAPLRTAVRLFLPPGLLRSVRTVLTPLTLPEAAPDMPVVPDVPAELPQDAAALLALLRERGWLAREQVVEVLGQQRARAAIRRLLGAGVAALSLRAPEAFLHARSERRVRMVADLETLERWREAARAEVDTLAGAGAPPQPQRQRQRQRPARERARVGRDASERRVERLLRQLAAVDVLARPARDGLVAESWRIEELRRLTRATPAALEELVRAGILAVESAEVRHDPLAGQHVPRTEPLALTVAQSAALRAIIADEPEAQSSASGRVFLLHGITGSGKTEVYLQALAAVLARGQRGIVLVPEIALTPQAMARFVGRFPGRVALLHSGLTDAERLSEWRRIRAGEVDVVLGSRSALFAPVEKLGLIVVDEEHEAAYKEERAPTYTARDVAAQLGALSGAAVVLGSATPSVETYWRASQGEYALLELAERAPAGRAPDAPETPGVRAAPAPRVSLPEVAVVDLRAELRAGNTSILSGALQAALRRTLERGEQAILFLNRRGMASSVVCRECGYVVRCVSCDVSLTYHAGEQALICHYCGRHEAAPQSCPVCHSASIRYFGLGTERVEFAVKRQFPAARVLRWDRDTARTRHAHAELLNAFASRRADILVGTQMIAKGLDLPAVTLVGVVSADIALFLPDFRSSERAFQLLTQVAGRAGRGELPGSVLVQTFNPEHFCIQAAARHDYAAFVEAELAARRRFSYPPFRRFVKFTYEHSDRHTAQLRATTLAEHLERVIADVDPAASDIVGPAPAFMERLRGRYRWQVMLRSPDPRAILAALAATGALAPGWSVDIDPASSL